MDILKTTLGLILSFCSSTTLAEEAGYHIYMDPQTPSAARVVFYLPTTPKSNQLYLRGAQMNLTSQIADVRCNNHPLTADGAFSWQLPQQCQRVEWTTQFQPEPEDGILASRQASTLSKNKAWWLLSAPVSLLRLNNDATSYPITIHQQGKNDHQFELGSPSEAPGFYVFGNIPQTIVRHGNLKLTFVTDNPSLTKDIINADEYLEALSYLNTISGQSQIGLRQMQIIMLAITSRYGEMGGAAGFNAMLVNYITDLPADDKKHIYPIIIALHEHFHQISSGEHPTWMNESLAHYYAIKAAQSIYPDTPAMSEILKDLEKAPPANFLGLWTINRQVTIDRNYQNYGQFYAIGSAFWATLDQAIRHASPDESLDTYLATLMRTRFTTQETFVDQLARVTKAVPKATLQELAETFLNGNESP